MSESHAKAAVQEEMRRRYAPNPWDAPGERRPNKQRISNVGIRKGEQSEASRGGVAI